MPPFLSAAKCHQWYWRHGSVRPPQPILAAGDSRRNGSGFYKSFTILPTIARYSPQQRQAIADLWFSAMFNRFEAQPREGGGSSLAGEADTMCARWKEAVGRLSFGEMLADVCQFLALSSQENALKYFAS